MPLELDPNMPIELAPLAWMIGRWEGAGVVGYPTIESLNFGQEIHCFHDGRPFLEWHSRTWALDDEGNKVRPLATELGFWRPLPDNEVELVLTHPTGIVELYYGTTSPAKVELRTDGVLRSPHAKEYNAGARMYGYVNSNLMWAMDMAAVGEPLQSHVSAELKRVSNH
ncbi:FABP family protein [Yimella sp. cx-51]|uniref:FABP family protein n=1 Tax=Yimella sp. cx-51 TaxID=2770551 RepID=UPI00165D858D|nr:FABP family protein [Yimella sp. cx-51]MBC9955770.1 FABP family protein [Yimella sp. cx-51]QTH37667.1 FABP family protein [Yimella sp. cx-51]